MERKIDELGRIVIPKDLRKQLGVKNGDPVKLKFADGNIVISKTSENELRNYIVGVMLDKKTTGDVRKVLDEILTRLGE